MNHQKEILREIWGAIPMKGRYCLFFMIGLIFTAFGFLVGCSTWKADSPLEELAEQVIEGTMGLPEGSLDLTPFSPES